MEFYNKRQHLLHAFEAFKRKGLIKNWTDFADIIGVNRSVLSAAKNGDEKYLTDTLMSKVKAAYEKHITPPEQSEECVTQEMVLVIPTGAMGGTLAEFAQSVSAYDCEKMISPIKGADYVIQVTGDSMSPEYPSGSMVLIKKINEKAFIEWGKTYVLDTENGAVIKTIRKTEDPEVIECVSLNPAYQPFTMETRYINGWYRVLMCLSLK